VDLRKPHSHLVRTRDVSDPRAQPGADTPNLADLLRACTPMTASVHGSPGLGRHVLALDLVRRTRRGNSLRATSAAKSFGAADTAARTDSRRDDSGHHRTQCVPSKLARGHRELQRAPQRTGTCLKMLPNPPTAPRNTYRDPELTSCGPATPIRALVPTPRQRVYSGGTDSRTWRSSARNVEAEVRA